GSRSAGGKVDNQSPGRPDVTQNNAHITRIRTSRGVWRAPSGTAGWPLTPISAPAPISPVSALSNRRRFDLDQQLRLREARDAEQRAGRLDRQRAEPCLDGLARAPERFHVGHVVVQSNDVLE